MKCSWFAGCCAIGPLVALACSSPNESAIRPGHGGYDAGATDGSNKDGAAGSPDGSVVPDGAGGSLPDGGDGPAEAPSVCTPGLIDCQNNEKRLCQPDGTWGPPEICGVKVCSNLFGCVECLPGTGACSSPTTAHRCKDDGSGWYDESCDPLLGSTCDENEGGCTGNCTPSKLGKSYIGCEYYPTVTGNEVLTLFDYAVAVSNTTANQATVTIDGGGLGAPVTFTIAPNNVHVQTLPWVMLLKGDCNGSYIECGAPTYPASLAVKGAFHLRSTQPVTVYQFNALQYQKSGSYSYTNDASLLLPVNAWGTSYVASSWPAWNGFPGLVTVTASQDATTVTIKAKASTGAGNGAPAFAAGVPGSATLNAGDAMEIFAYSGDLTGSEISADKPIQVVSGHDCTQVPIGTTACDHLEESMFPTATLGASYIVTAPALPSMPNGKVNIIRIVAARPNITLTYDPPQSAPNSLANVGDMIQITGTTQSFQITGSDKILVSQYMEGQDAGGGMGDPAMTLAVPTKQFRKSYLFHAPTNYDTNYVNVVAPSNATVTLDGAPVAGFTPIGATGYGVARVVVSNAGTGNHDISGSEPFGITVYGYGSYTSFWYPGGLNLMDL